MKDSGMYNIGQLVREARGEEDVVLVGFGAYSGTVIAAEEWGSPMQVMTVPRARSGSIEQVLHDDSPEDKLLIFDTHSKQERFNKSLPHRAIGVVYHPQYEQYGNYVPTVLNSRYNAFVFLDHTRALNPVHMTADPHQVPEGYPFGF
jgi:erythromycin esterase